MVAHRPDLREDVAAQKHGVLLGQVPDQRADLHHLLGVQANSGLVEDDDGRKAQNGLGQAHPLPVALGEVADQPLRLSVQVGQGQHLIQILFPPLRRQLFQLRAEPQILQHRHIGIQRRDLRQVAHALAGGFRLFQNVVALDEHVSLRGGQIAGHDVHGGGLSGAVGPQQAEYLPVLHGKAQVIHRAVVPVPLYEIFDLDHTNLHAPAGALI